MAITSDKLELILPDRGEFPGEWDTPLNSNLEKIDLFLWKAYTHNPSVAQPAATEMIGSSWYKTAEKLLLLKGADGFYHAAARHKHTDLSADGDFSKVDLTDGNEVRGTLPSYMVQYSGLDAEKLGGKLSGEYVSLGGTGIEVYTDTASGQGAARIKPVAGFTNNQEFNRVFVDISGRVIAGELKNTLSGLGITDGVTKLYADATYATQAALAGVESGFTTDLQDWVTLYFASKNGNASQSFAVQTNGSNAADAVSVTWASTFLASKAGDALVKFLVANSTAATQEAVPRSQADTLYATAGHNHDATYVNTAGDTMTGLLTVPTLTSTGLINANGSINIPTGRVVTIVDAPVLGTSAVNLNYLTSNYATITGVSGAYAPKAGNLLQAFAVANPITGFDAIPKAYADANYSNLVAVADAINSHSQSGAHDSRYVLAGNTAKATSLNIGFFRTRIDANGTPDVFSVTGNNVDMFASASSPTTIFVPSGVDINGVKSTVMSTSVPVTNCFSLTPLLPSTTHYAYVQAVGTQTLTITGDLAAQLDSWALTDTTVGSDWQNTSLIWEITWTVAGAVTRVDVYNNVAKDIHLCGGARSGDTLAATITLAEVGGSGLSGSVHIKAGVPVVDTDIDNTIIISTTYSGLTANAFGYSTLAPIYSFSVPAAPATGQIWFNINDYIYMKYNGSVWTAMNLVFLATITTNGSNTPTITAYHKNRLAHDFRVPTPTIDDQSANKKYVDDADAGKAALAGSGTQAFATAALTSTSITASGEIAGPQFKVTPEGGYAVKFINLTGAPTVKGNVTHLLHPTITEAGDTSNQLSTWTFYGAAIANTNLGTVYWELLWTLAGQITTINIFKDLAKTQLVASGTRSGNTTAGTITLTAQNASGLTGSVAITGGANPTQDNDAANTLFIGVDGAIGLEEPNDTMPMGIIYEAGIANGSDVWVVVAGKADVLLDDAQVVTRGGVLLMSATTLGRADFVPQGTVLTTTQHFEELGHTLHGVPAGTNRLVRAILHWN